jgi:REP element-mobilizing transposase RayT
MKVDYNNLYIHFVFTTTGRLPFIKENHRERIEKYITGIIKNHSSRLYAIYANPEHMHFIVSKSPDYSENQLAEIIADASAKLSMTITYAKASSPGNKVAQHSQSQSQMSIRFAVTF